MRAVTAGYQDQAIVVLYRLVIDMTDTRAILLREAEALLRTCGYSAFSYADLAERVRIRKASIHYYFPTKEALGLSLIEDYLTAFALELEAIDQAHADVRDRLRAYAQFFFSSIKGRQLPLCGALAAEISSIPESMQKKTKLFFKIHLDWLAGTIEAGVKDEVFRQDLDARKSAHFLLSILEGGSLISWVTTDKKLLESSFESALNSLS